MSSLELPVASKLVPTVNPRQRRPLSTLSISLLTLGSLLLAWWAVTTAG